LRWPDKEKGGRRIIGVFKMNLQGGGGKKQKGDVTPCDRGGRMQGKRKGQNNREKKKRGEIHLWKEGL